MNFEEKLHNIIQELHKLNTRISIIQDNNTTEIQFEAKTEEEIKSIIKIAEKCGWKRFQATELKYTR